MVKILAPAALALLCCPALFAQSSAPDTKSQTAAPIISLQAVPDSAFAHSISAYKNGDIAAALGEMKKATQQNPQDAAAQRWLGFLFVRNHEPRQALIPLNRSIELLTKATKLPLANLPALRSDMADTYTHLGDALSAVPNASPTEKKAAVEAFRKAAQMTQTASAFYNLGFAAVRAGTYDEAAKAYRKSIALAPKDDRAWRSYSALGYALQKQGATKYTEAVDAYREAAKLKPQEAAVWGSLGMIQMERGAANRAAAITALETAHKLQPAHYSVVTTLARAYAESNRFEEAAALFTAALELPEAKNAQFQAALFYNRGVVQARAKKLAEAQSSYERALGLKPKYFDALVNLGFVLYAENKVDDALARFRQAITVRGDSYLAWSNMGVALMQKKDLPNATIAWRKAAQLEPQSYDARAILADLLTEQNRTDEAIAVYRQMAALRPQNALAMNALGLAYQKKNDRDGAFAAFKEAVRRDPKDAASRNNLGVLYEQRGDLVNAIREYKNALQIAPAFADAKTNLDRFGSQAATIKPTVTANEKPLTVPVKTTPMKSGKEGRPNPTKSNGTKPLGKRTT